jgi:hypothetical protein
MRGRSTRECLGVTCEAVSPVTVDPVVVVHGETGIAGFENILKMPRIVVVNDTSLVSLRCPDNMKERGVGRRPTRVR